MKAMERMPPLRTRGLPLTGLWMYNRSVSNLHRIQWIDAQIREGRFPNCSTIAAHFEISVRQASRDIEYLKYSLSAPLEYSGRHQGYYYTEKAFALPAFFIGEEEKQALAYLAERYRSGGGEMTAKLAAFFERLGGDERGEKQINRAIPVYPLTDRELSRHNTLKTAILRRRTVEIVYIDNGNRKSERMIRPYVMFRRKNALYIHAFCEKRGAERDFRIDRIVSAKPGGGTFTIPASFDAGAYEKSVRFEYRLPYEALVEFDRPVNTDGALALIPSGLNTYRISFSSSTALLSKLIACGAGFTVRRPAWLKEKCGDFFSRLAEKNR